MGAGETAQLLGALAVLAEDSGSMPSTSMSGRLTIFCNSFQGI